VAHLSGGNRRIRGGADTGSAADPRRWREVYQGCLSETQQRLFGDFFDFFLLQLELLAESIPPEERLALWADQERLARLSPKDLKAEVQGRTGV
jgi:hypothetical protein